MRTSRANKERYKGIRQPTITFVRLGKARPSHRKGCKTPFGDCLAGAGIIRIDPRQDEREMLDTIVHELTHDVMPFLNEDSVDAIGLFVSQALWKQGYRRILDKKDEK